MPRKSSRLLLAPPSAPLRPPHSLRMVRVTTQHSTAHNTPPRSTHTQTHYTPSPQPSSTPIFRSNQQSTHNVQNHNSTTTDSSVHSPPATYPHTIPGYPTRRGRMVIQPRGHPREKMFTQSQILSHHRPLRRKRPTPTDYLTSPHQAPPRASLSSPHPTLRHAKHGYRPNHRHYLY